MSNATFQNFELIYRMCFLGLLNFPYFIQLRNNRFYKNVVKRHGILIAIQLCKDHYRGVKQNCSLLFRIIIKYEFQN